MNCKDPACVDGYIHEAGDVSSCMSCVRHFFVEDIERRVRDGAKSLYSVELATLPNRRVRRSAIAGRHARGLYLWERHDERAMFRALAHDGVVVP